MSKIRTFIAIDTPEPIKDKIFEVQNLLRESDADVRWESRDKFHITVKFLGGTEESILSEIIQNLSATLTPFKPFQLLYDGLGCFPNIRSPRVIWVGCENEDGTLLKIYQTIEDIVGPFGFEKESRRFHPHITLGRVKSPKRIQDLIRTMQSTTFDRQITECRELHVVKSDLRPTGSVYTVLHRIHLLPAKT
ncbi:MAG: RNA 2',3'-cyclic phosphodiesterase [Bacteroidota bacterium]